MRDKRKPFEGTTAVVVSDAERSGRANDAPVAATDALIVEVFESISVRPEVDEST